jgi:hypothetical protein
MSQRLKQNRGKVIMKVVKARIRPSLSVERARPDQAAHPSAQDHTVCFYRLVRPREIAKAVGIPNR